MSVSMGFKIPYWTTLSTGSLGSKESGKFQVSQSSLINTLRTKIYMQQILDICGFGSQRAFGTGDGNQTTNTGNLCHE